jgi:hypothetical protein
VFLQSDILHAAEGLRDAFEEVVPDAFDLAPPHSDPARVFLAGPLTALAADSEGPRTDGSGKEEGDAAAAARGAAGEDSWEFLGAAAGGASSDDTDGEATVFVSEWAKAGWLRDNPVGVPTEREYYVAATQGGDVYRVLLVKR